MVCMLSLTFLYALLFIGLHFIEHCYRYPRRLTPRLCRSSRRCLALVLLGLSGRRRPASQRRHRRLGRLIHHHLHHPALRRGLYIARIGRRRSIGRSLRTHLHWPALLHTKDFPQASLEPGSMEQALSGDFCLVERMGGRGALLAIRIPRYGLYTQLCTGDYGSRDNLCAAFLVVDSGRQMAAEPADKRAAPGRRICG